MKDHYYKVIVIDDKGKVSICNNSFLLSFIELLILLLLLLL